MTVSPLLLHVADPYGTTRTIELSSSHEHSLRALEMEIQRVCGLGNNSFGLRYLGGDKAQTAVNSNEDLQALLEWAFRTQQPGIRMIVVLNAGATGAVSAGNHQWETPASFASSSNSKAPPPLPYRYDQPPPASDFRSLIEQVKAKVSATAERPEVNHALQRFNTVVSQVTAKVHNTAAENPELADLSKHLQTTGKHVGSAVGHSVSAAQSYVDTSNPLARQVTAKAVSDASNAAKLAFEESKLVVQATKGILLKKNSAVAVNAVNYNSSSSASGSNPVNMVDSNEPLPLYSSDNRYRQEMQQLKDMGFVEEDTNWSLLNAHDGNVDKVVDALMRQSST
ncbi:hypothetical protein BJ741DRAFT_707907 [Chytriomyces cf. hyalinus JEL632]|nr:hypothetical protein BJ741DRAFT_707907 [Chytriomyces cf. hyalinus JEL632]